MRSRTYVIIGIALALVLGAVIATQVQRARKTAELLDDLDTDASDVATDTMQELRKRGHRVEDQLIERTRSSRRKERMRAALLLGEVGTQKSGPALVGLLEDEWPPVRRAAVWALGKIAYQPAVSNLLAIVGDEKAEMDTRCLAVQSLSLLCMSGLDEADRRLCVPPMVTIMERRPKLTEEQLTTLRETKAKAKAEREAAKRGEVLEEEAAEAKPAETKAAEEEIPAEPVPADTEIELRGEAVLLLGSTEAAEALKPLLHSADEEVEPAPLVRQHACMALGDLPEVPTDDVNAGLMGHALLNALEDTDATVRMFAARALARHPSFGKVNAGVDTSANERLAEMAEELTSLGEPAYWVREAARTACDARHVPYQTERAEKTEAAPPEKVVRPVSTGGK